MELRLFCVCIKVGYVFFFKEFQISAFEQKIIQEIEIRILRITYQMLIAEDREEMVMIAEHEATQPAFDTPVKSYRILEGMGVTFHCKMAGTPLPKVQPLNLFIIIIIICFVQNMKYWSALNVSQNL